MVFTLESWSHIFISYVVFGFNIHRSILSWTNTYSSEDSFWAQWLRFCVCRGTWSKKGTLEGMPYENWPDRPSSLKRVLILHRWKCGVLLRKAPWTIHFLISRSSMDQYQLALTFPLSRSILIDHNFGICYTGILWIIFIIFIKLFWHLQFAACRVV